ncbi:MAG: hypothetical protein KAT38_10730, partial [Bacteroidales bacterium]|nr:hypothetical protein [Bacteroidales bacterium]
VEVFKTVSVTRLSKLPLVRQAGLIIDIWSQKLSDLLFVFCYLPFSALFTRILGLKNKHHL